MEPILEGINWFAGQEIGNSNSYLIQRDGLNALVDPGGLGFEETRAEQIRQILSLDDISIVVNTHCHYDHIGGNRKLVGTGAVIKAHALDAPHIANADEFTLAPGGLEKVKVEPLQEGDLIAGFKVLHTPGHTQGSLCLYDAEQKTLISGDTIFDFSGSRGRTDLPGGDETMMLETLKRIGEIEIENLLPGHGKPIRKSGASNES